MTRTEHTAMVVKPFRTEASASKHGTPIRYSYGWLALNGTEWRDYLGPLVGWKPNAELIRPAKGA